MKLWLSAWRTRVADLSLFRKMYLSNLLLIAVPILILSFFSIQLFNGILVKYSIHNSVQNLELIDRSVTDSFGQAQLLFQIVAANPSIQDILEREQKAGDFDRLGFQSEIRAIMDNMVEPKSAVSSMALYTVSGDTYGSGRIIGYYEQTRHWQAIARGADGSPLRSSWDDVHAVGGVNYISLTRPVYSSMDGRPLASLELNIDENFLSSLYAVLKYGQSGHFFIVNNDGIIVSSTDKQEIHRDIRGLSYYGWLNGHDREGKVFEQDGKPYLITAHRLGDNGLGWTIVGSVPLHELLSDVDMVTRLVVIVGVVCTVLVIGTAFFLSRSISKPIIDLSRTMVKAGNGDLSVRMSVTSRSDVGLLARSFNKMLNQISELMQQIFAEQRRKRQYELIALQAQINPHFLYNTLDSICSLIQMERKHDAFQSVKALSQFYKIILSKGRDVIAVRDEIDNVRSYLKIQKMRYADKFDYVIDTDESIGECQIVKLSIQPLVENAIYHGLRPKRGGGTIRIVGRREQSCIRLSVGDDGVGFDPGGEGASRAAEPSSSRRSFGLRSVDERIKLHFGSEYGVRIDSRIGEGATVHVLIPAIPLKETNDDTNDDRG